MKSRQSGFTLVEIAIVLVIVGLFLGAILKGQELINTAKVKNLANDFRAIPTYIYAYQDKFKSLPGDDSGAMTHLGASCAAPCQNGNGNGVINGNWNSATATDESRQFWAHVRLAKLATGPTLVTDADYAQKNAMGQIVGISSGTAAQLQIAGMKGSYQVCSSGLPGKFAKQLDIQMDDGNTATGSMRAVLDGAALGSAAVATNAIDETAAYTVCYVF